MLTSKYQWMAFKKSQFFKILTIFIDSSCCYVGQWEIINYGNKVTTLFLKPNGLANF
jgi:hypothetical protein